MDSTIIRTNNTWIKIEGFIKANQGSNSSYPTCALDGPKKRKTQLFNTLYIKGIGIEYTFYIKNENGNESVPIKLGIETYHSFDRVLEQLKITQLNEIGL